DAEVAELEPRSLAHEHVERREVAVEELAAVEPTQHVEDAGDLAARRGLGPRFPGALEERAEVAVARVLERQVVEDQTVAPGEREAVVDADRARRAREQLAEVGLADPGVDVRAHLDADGAWDLARTPEPRREID